MKKEELMFFDLGKQLQRVMSVNDCTSRYGLILTEEDAKQLLDDRKDSLVEKRRVEFGEGILLKLIESFCDSSFIYQDNYVETISRLQDIFYEYKNESMDGLSDDELLLFMRNEFEGDCQGSVDFLEETILENIARNVRKSGERYLRECRKEGMKRNGEEL